MQKNISQSNNNSYIANANTQKPAIQAKAKVMPSRQSSKPPIQAKQRPVQAKQSKLPPIQAKQSRLPPIQAKKGFANELKSMTKNASLEEAKTGAATSLPTQMKTNMEQMGGVDLSDVKVFPNSEKPAQLKAEAYAQGNEIHLSNGQHLGHEAWHVVQQKQGRVMPTIQANNGAQINADSALEKEADDMGAKAIQMKSTKDDSKLPSKNMPPTQLKATNTNVIQRKGGNISGDVFDADFYGIYENQISYINTELTEYDMAGSDDFSEQLSLIGLMKMMVNQKISQGKNKDINQKMYDRLVAEENLVKQQMKESEKEQQKNDENLNDTPETAPKNEIKQPLPKTQLNKVDSEPRLAIENNKLAKPKQKEKSASPREQMEAKHQRDRQALIDLVTNGLKSHNRMERNTCEWIFLRKVQVYALTTTHDAQDRASRHGYDGQRAAFPSGNAKGDIFSEATSYDDDINSTRNITYIGTESGWADGKKVYIVNASGVKPTQLINTLSHEIQHVADGHDTKEEMHKAKDIELDTKLRNVGVELADIKGTYDHLKQLAQKEYNDLGTKTQEMVTEEDVLNKMMMQQSFDKSRIDGLESRRQLLMNQRNAERALNFYKTEYRAYGYELHSEHSGGDEVEKHIFKAYGHQKSLNKSWKEDVQLADSTQTFRDAIKAYQNPDTEGFNKYNSIRIDAFFKELQKYKKEYDMNSDEFKALEGTISNLKTEDAVYILTEGQALRNLIRAHLGAGEAKLIFGALQRKAKRGQ
ncbi:MAG TPA: hypothetical protein DCS93_27820 [Microscillaceae bacterium]|nr:hypothetical protein [Microscillaceae bacterium]